MTLLFGTASVILWRADIRWLAILLISLAPSLVLGVLVNKMASPSAPVIGWPIALAMRLLPLHLLHIGITPDRAFPFALGLSLIANATIVVATALIGLRATGRHSVGLIAAGLYTTWPIWVGLIACRRRRTDNGSSTSGSLCTTSRSRQPSWRPPSCCSYSRACLRRLPPSQVSCSASQPPSSSRTARSRRASSSSWPSASVSTAPPFSRSAAWCRYRSYSASGRRATPTRRCARERPRRALPTPICLTKRQRVHDLHDVDAAPTPPARSARLREGDQWYRRALLIVPIVVTIACYASYYVTNQHPRFYFVILPAIFVLQASGVALIWDAGRRRFTNDSSLASSDVR